MRVGGDLAAVGEHGEEPRSRALGAGLHGRERQAELARDLGLDLAAHVHAAQELAVLLAQGPEHGLEAARELGGRVRPQGLRGA